MHENLTPFTKNGNGVRNNKPLEAYNNDCIEIKKRVMQFGLTCLNSFEDSLFLGKG
jgi:hypothetical protein